MPKLTDIQLVSLSAAAKRDDGSLLPLPKKLQLKGDAVTSMLKVLLKKGLVEEQGARLDSAAWREDSDGHRIMLSISKHGLRAISVEPNNQPQTKAAIGKHRRKDPPSTARPLSAAKLRGDSTKVRRLGTRSGTKQAKVIQLMRRPVGASIEELVKATGWQSHSLRGVISGALKKKLGLEVASTKEDRGRVYRIITTSSGKRAA
jgi:DNA-binding MarR family transcriptional regulator